MDSDTTFSKFRQARDVRAQLNSTSELPFKQILCSIVFAGALARQNVEYRTRFYPPDKTLLTFLAQVLSDDKSCQAAVGKMIGHELTALYDHRWLVELDLRAIKPTMKMDILRGKTPDMVRKEIGAHLLAYNLIRKIMAQAAQIDQKNPRHLSFKLALQVIGAFRQGGVFGEGQIDLYEQLLNAIAYQTVGNRPGRHEPRRVKRRPKPYPRLVKPRHLYQKKAA